MSIAPRLWRLGVLALAVTPLFACSNTMISRNIEPSATEPQNVATISQDATATDVFRQPTIDTADASTADVSTTDVPTADTQDVPSQNVIPPMVVADLARGVASEKLDTASASKPTGSKTTVTVASAAASISPPQDPESSDLFGESATAANQPFQRWLNVLARFNAQQNDPAYACPPNSQQTCALAWWNNFVNKLRSLPLRARVIAVNDVLNQVPYVPAESNWGDPGYWETPLEFLTHAGQCQDYANTKYLALAESGVPAALMRFVVVRDKVEALDHAVLVVYVNDEPMVLDNQNPAVLPADEIQRYAPYYALNTQEAWVYPSPVPQTAAADQIAPLPTATFQLARD